MHTTAPIPPLRPNYTAADFEIGQCVILRSDGRAGVPLCLSGERASVVKSMPRRLRVRLGGVGGAIRELSVTPNQVALILAE